MEKAFPKQQDEQWRVLEFYSGIGGMRYSLLSAGVDAKVVQAFDINDKANDVYEHSFGDRPYQKEKESYKKDSKLESKKRTMESLEFFNNIGCMVDEEMINVGAVQMIGSVIFVQFMESKLTFVRAVILATTKLMFGFCHLLANYILDKVYKSIPAMLGHFHSSKFLSWCYKHQRPPVLLFMENVVGFETSDTHTTMVDILEKAGFSRQDFILSPMHFGVPYSRPRCFCLAKGRPLSFQRQSYSNQLLWSPSPFLENDVDLEIIENRGSQAASDKLLLSCEPTCRFLDKSNHHNEFSFSDSSSIHREGALVNTKDANEHDNGSFDQYLVPSSLIDRWGRAMGIQT